MAGFRSSGGDVARVASATLVRAVQPILLTVALTGAVQAATFDFEDFGRPAPGGSASELWESLDPALAESLKSAIRSLDAGAFEEAESAARHVVDGAPESAEGWHILGMVLANLGRVDESVAALDRAASLYDENAEPLVVKGDLLLSTGDRAGARKAYAAAVERDPSNWRASEMLATLLVEDGDAEAAMAQYEATIAEAPADHRAPRLRLAQLYLNAGRSDDAEDLLETYLEANPADTAALGALGRLRLGLGQQEAAAEAFARAIEAAPDNRGLRLELAAAEKEAGRLPEATAALEAAWERFPEDVEIARELATLYGAQREYSRAAETFETALELAPNDPALLKGLSLALYRAGRVDEAQPPASALAERQNAGAGDHLWLGIVEEARGRPEPAIAAYDTALTLEPQNWIAANNLAVLLFERNPERAVALAEQAAAHAGEVSSVRDTLATAYLKSGRAGEAVRIFSELAAEAPENPVVAYRFGRALLAQGRTDTGRAELERALTLDPHFAHADEAREMLAVQ